jgi:hypothetical protein
MSNDRPLNQQEKDFKRLLSNRINPSLIVKNEGDFIVSAGSASPDAKAILNLYADLLSVSQEGYPYNIKITMPHESERPMISLEVDLKKTVEDGLPQKLANIKQTNR